MSGVALILSCYVLLSLKGKKMSEVTAKGAGREEEEVQEPEKWQPEQADYVTCYL